MKNERERVFAYSFHTVCDKKGFILSPQVEPSNVHDSQVLTSLLDKIKKTVQKP